VERRQPLPGEQMVDPEVDEQLELEPRRRAARREADDVGLVTGPHDHCVGADAKLECSGVSPATKPDENPNDRRAHRIRG
jgi:hypothetical protein